MDGKQSPDLEARLRLAPDPAPSDPPQLTAESSVEKLKISDPRRADHLDEFKWKKGESGNLNGRPKGRVSLTSRLRSQLLEELPNAQSDKVKADLIIHALVEEARAGNMQAIICILDRLEGKVTDKVEMSGSSVIFNVIEARKPE